MFRVQGETQVVAAAYAVVAPGGDRGVLAAQARRARSREVVGLD